MLRPTIASVESWAVSSLGRTFIGILKSPPSADVIRKDYVEPGITALDIVNELPERFPPLDLQTTLSSV